MSSSHDFLAVNSVYKKHVLNKYKNLYMQKIALFRFSFPILLMDLKFIYLRKRLFLMYKSLFFMIIFYPDKSIKFFFRKIKLFIFNYKNKNLLK